MIPVAVLTGFLGSGKTTILSRLLRRPELARTAVIINELGEIGLDHDLIEASDESLVRLSTGCLCCAARGDIEATIAGLLARRGRGEADFERIVIETSGLADPAPVLNAIIMEAGRGSPIRLAAVTAAIDAVVGLATLAREEQSRRQVAAADRLIVTKTDMTSGSVPAELAALVGRLNPRARMHLAVNGLVDPALVIAEAPPEEWAEAWAAAAADPVRHAPDIGAISIRRPAPIAAATLPLLLEALAQHLGADLLRLKGIVAIAERPDRPVVLHGVQHLFHPPSWLERWPSPDTATRLVLIGRRLSRAWVECLIEAIEAEVREIASARPST